MKATYRISEDDYVNAMKLFYKLSPILIAIFLAVTLVLIGLIVFGSPATQAGAIGGLAGGAIVLVVGRYIISPIISRQHYRKYKAIHEEMTIELLDDGLRFFSKNGDGKLIWDNMLKWRQNDKYILIYPMPRLYYVLPKSIESNGFDVSLLTSQLAKHVGKPI